MRVHFFDPAATLELPASPSVGIPSRMPFLLSSDGSPVSDVNAWLRSLPTAGAPAPATWHAYARDLADWVRFLEAIGVPLFAETDRLVAAVRDYHALRRMGPLDRRLTSGSWNRAVHAIASFYGWAVETGRAPAVPFTIRRLRRMIGGEMVTLDRNMAKEASGRRGAAIRWLDDEYAELLGKCLELGRNGGRNAAAGRFAMGSGLRLQEFSHLLVYELPERTAERALPVPLGVPGAIAKRGVTRTTFVDADALARVHDYVRLERALSGTAWSPRVPIHFERPTRTGAVIGGRTVRWTALAPDERRRLVGPDGRSPMVWLSTDGSPVVRWDHVLVRAASAARAIAPRFPHVTAHMLRHTFAVRTLRWLTSTQIRALIGIQGVFGDDLDPALAEALRRQDPLLVLRDLLGHRSVTTTELYLQFIDPTRLFAVADIEESL